MQDLKKKIPVNLFPECICFAEKQGQRCGGEIPLTSVNCRTHGTCDKETNTLIPLGRDLRRSVDRHAECQEHQRSLTDRQDRHQSTPLLKDL